MANAVKIVFTSFARASSGLDVVTLNPPVSVENALAAARFRLCMETPAVTIHMDDGTTIRESWHNPKAKSVKVKPASPARAKATRKAPKASPAAETQASTEAPAEQSVAPAKVKRGVDAVFYYTGGGTKTAHYENKAQARSEAKHTLRDSQAFMRVVIDGTESISRVSLIASATSYDPERASVDAYWARIHRENAKTA